MLQSKKIWQGATETALYLQTSAVPWRSFWTSFKHLVLFLFDLILLSGGTILGSFPSTPSPLSHFILDLNHTRISVKLPECFAHGNTLRGTSSHFPAHQSTLEGISLHIYPNYDTLEGISLHIYYWYCTLEGSSLHFPDQRSTLEGS